MKRKLFREKVKNRGGFSIVEVVVGLTVVVMVTAAALSVILASVQMEAKYLNETTALCACESVVACVRFADNADELAAALETLTEEPAVQEDGAETPVERVEKTVEDGKTVLKFKQNTVQVTVKFAADAFDAAAADRNFEITAMTMSGEEIQQVQYEKN